MAKKKKTNVVSKVFNDARRNSAGSIAGGKLQAADRSTAKKIRKVATRINKSSAKNVLKSRVSSKDKARIVSKIAGNEVKARVGIGALRAASKAGSTVGTAQRAAKVAQAGARSGAAAAAGKKKLFASRDDMTVSNQFRNQNWFGKKRKGNVAGKTAAVVGVLAGAGKYKLSAARKAALRKAQKASAMARRRR